MPLTSMKYQHRVLGMLSLLAVITYLDRVCIAVAGPRMQDALRISPEAWGWVTSVFFLSYGAFEIPTGALGDRIGPRRVLTRVVAWWSAFTTLTGTVSNYYVLLLVRFCFGAGEAGAYPNASVVIGRWFPVAKRTRAWGTVWMTSQVGAALSPLLVVPIQVRYGWRAPFFVFGLLGVVWSLAWYVWFRDSPQEKAGVTEAERREIGPAPGLQTHSMPWATAMRLPALWRIAAIGACYVYALGFFQSWLQTYLVKGRGFSEAALALSSLTYAVGATANGLGGLAGDWMVRRHGLRKGRRWLGVAGLSAAALFLAAAIFVQGGNLALVCLSLAYGGILFQQPSLCALCLDVGRKHAGAVFGFMNTAASAASALSAVVFGYLVAYSGNYNTPFLPMVALLSVGALLWLQVDPTCELFPEALPAEAVSARTSAVMQTTGGYRSSE
jgi:ACS family glucarate transporter-like MFS transporter